MKHTRKVSDLEPKVWDILTITLEGIVPDLRPLVAALFLSDPEELIRIKQYYPEEHMIFLAVDAVQDFRTNPVMLRQFISSGFFNEQLEYLLAIAKSNHDAGARLMPVFCSALTSADILAISCELQAQIESHIEKQRQEDGFAITELAHGKIIVVPADDVIPS